VRMRMTCVGSWTTARFVRCGSSGILCCARWTL
jgi:hypothetical protein